MAYQSMTQEANVSEYLSEFPRLRESSIVMPVILTDSSISRELTKRRQSVPSFVAPERSRLTATGGVRKRHISNFEDYSLCPWQYYVQSQRYDSPHLSRNGFQLEHERKCKCPGQSCGCGGRRPWPVTRCRCTNSLLAPACFLKTRERCRS